mmetsp:Transcript_33666/g.77716  ORF Transcript_33666/g.77716 Transcript_33666/m.77716 type:complete len:201 (-) Transcript_33666:524-1126(-)
MEVRDRCSSSAVLCSAWRNSTIKSKESRACSTSAQSATFTRTNLLNATALWTNSCRSRSDNRPSSSELPSGASRALLAWSPESVSELNGSNNFDKAPVRIPNLLACSSKVSRNSRHFCAPRAVAMMAASLAKASSPSRKRNCTRDHCCFSAPRLSEVTSGGKWNGDTARGRREDLLGVLALSTESSAFGLACLRPRASVK